MLTNISKATAAVLSLSLRTIQQITSDGNKHPVLDFMNNTETPADSKFFSHRNRNLTKSGSHI